MSDQTNKTHIASTDARFASDKEYLCKLMYEFRYHQDMEQIVLRLGPLRGLSICINVLEREIVEARERERSLLKSFREAREAAQAANDSRGGGIVDTIWMPGRPETLFDFMDSVIEEAEKLISPA